MSPGQTEREGWIAWVTYHLLLGESPYEIEGDFAQRFGQVPPGTWPDVLAAAFAGVNAAASAFGADLSTTVGSHIPTTTVGDFFVSVRMRVHFHFPDGTDKWMIVDLVVHSRENMAELYSDAISHAEQLAMRSGSSLVELDLLPPFYELQG